MHRTREQVSALFKETHRQPHSSEDVPAMVESARRELREKFLTAEVGISGANFLVADTGAVCTVTNEGNAELTTTPPQRAHRDRGDREAGADDRARHRACCGCSSARPRVAS